MRTTQAAFAARITLITATLALAACGSDNSDSSTTPPPDFGEPTDMLEPLRIEGAMCPTLRTSDIKVLRNGAFLTIKALKQSGVAKHNPDPTKTNEAHCKMAFWVETDTPFQRRSAGGTVRGRYASKAKEDSVVTFTSTLSQKAEWVTDSGSTISMPSTMASDNNGEVVFDSDFWSDFGTQGNLELTVEVNAEHEGYPVAYEWDGIIRFETKKAAP